MNILSLLNGLFGVILLIGISFLLSNNKKMINWRLVISGLILQVVFAFIVLKGDYLGQLFFPLSYPKLLFEYIGRFFVTLLGFTEQGAQFVFGRLALGPENQQSIGMIFAFRILPTIIFFSSLMAVLYYLGIMQRIVQGMAWVFAKIMGTSGAESLSSTASIFVGQTEAPLMIRPFMKSLTNSEFHTIMVSGFAHISGGVMVAYIAILSAPYALAHGVAAPEAQIKFATNLLAACIMATPACLAISKIIFPETEKPVTQGKVSVNIEKNGSNVIEAAAIGASEGLQLVLNVGAMLIAFIALIALVNSLLGWIGSWSGLNALFMSWFNKPFSLQVIFGAMLQYLAVAIGVPWQDALNFGSLVGTKLVLNEFVAYLDMGEMIKMGTLATEKGITMATFALCGFANFASIAIMIGGLSPLAPERRQDIARLGLRALAGGTISSLMTATIAGFLI